MFLEFVMGDKKSAYLDGRTYGDIARMLGTDVDDVEEFEAYLKGKINPGKSFHGSFDPDPQDDNDYAQVDMFDDIENEDQYKSAYKFYCQDAHVSHSHHEDGL